MANIEIRNLSLLFTITLEVISSLIYLPLAFHINDETFFRLDLLCQSSVRLKESSSGKYTPIYI